MYQYKFDGREKPVDIQVSDRVIDGYISFLDGNPVDWTKKRYVNGELQDIPQPEPPAPYVPTLADVAGGKVAELKNARNEAEAATPFNYDGSNFDYDSLSRERINAAVSASTIAALSGTATSTIVATWTLADNTTHDMTIADWLAFRQAEVARSADCHASYNAKKATVAGYVAEVAAGTKTEDEAKAAIIAVGW